MIRKEPERGGGRRPLLAAFVGNNRQMLNDIRDSLSHLRKSQLEEDGEGGMQLKTELSQSTPNLADKSGAAGGTKKGLENHHKTLAEIREALRPFQTGRNRSQGASDGDVTRYKIQQVMLLGVDEDIAVRALKLCNNVDGAVQLLWNIIESRNGSSKISAGLPSYPVHRRPSFENKYGPSSPAASDTNSVRSDSPSLSNVPQAARQSLANGHQTPPPLPPRAPIGHPGSPHPSAGGHTPPPIPEGNVVGLNGAGPQGASSDVPPGHVQQLIKRMSPGQFRSQVVHNAPHQHSSNGTSISLQQQQRSVTRQSLVCQAQAQAQAQAHSQGGQMHHGHASAQAVTGALAQQLQQGLVITHQSVTSSPGSGNSSASSTPAPSGPRVTINVSHPPPPPYSQARGGTPTLVQIHGEQSHYLALAPPDSPLNLSTASSSAASALSDNSSGMMNHNGHLSGKMAPGLPVMAARRPQHAPIIMHSVKSKEVHKPVPQTATAPMSPPPNMATPPGSTSQHNYISQVQTQVNTGNGQVPSPVPVATAASAPTTTTTTHTRNLQIQITGQAPHHVVHSRPHNGVQYATEPVGPPYHAGGHAHSRPTIQFHIASGAHPNYPSHVHLQHFGGVSYDRYHCAPSDTTSTPRSDSPVSRTTNQSPLSVLSTTSSPSTNSDIPDKPPPPYPFGLHQSAPPRQPPLPPRVPLHNKPLPPPPPGTHGVTLHLPAKTVVSKAGGGQSVLPSSHPGVMPQTMVNQNGQATGSIETASEQGEDTDTETVSSSEAGTASGGGGGGGGGERGRSGGPGGEKHRCMSPMPQRKPEAWERDKLRRDTKVRNYSPQAFKFYMEQHVENVLKIHHQRLRRRTQLENEMAKVNLSEEAARQMRRMLHQKESNYIRLKRAKMDKSMFEKIKTLGVGAFGEVALCRKKDTGMLYAMKTLRKSDVLKRNQVAHVKAERDILAEADNEWVVKLYYSFQDHNYLYFVMDYVPGGDLMGLLIRMEILDEPLARFYIAELVQAIESVHRMGFIHRDIKPDNILIDRNGHIKLTDFGLCTGFRWTHNSKYYQRDGTHARQDSMEVNCKMDEQCHCEILKPLERRRKREQRCLAHSLVGTPNYIAPEVLLRSSGYTSVCDWWSVGVILFEMLVGHPPFYANTPAETQYKVINWKETLKVPRDSNLSQSAKDLILQLCCGPEDRLGLNGAMEIKAHSFFDGINFDTLRKQQPPYVPTIHYATDTSNFDPVDPDKLRNSEEEESKKTEKLENGKHPEHAFFEFTFRRFFDDGGHPMATTLEDPDTNSPVYV
ncbi:serine/threonine-protein kinase LATS1-like [Littorina saxatilis]|uniref:non-specific serine/threonine protein kinase n=1 Tax=Littorina saxatilis TaxID=31220 RepID=A0AAN9BMS8_9CAEN